MKKYIFMTLAFLYFVGCSQSEVVPKVPTSDRVEIRMTNSDVSVPKDFIPEHIKRSRIEVVKHY